jgi:hypothetical protein
MKMIIILSITAATLTACHTKTKKELLTKKWQLLNVYVDNEITDKPEVIKWLKEMNDTIKKSLVVTEYAKNNKFLCYLDNILLNGISADKSCNDYFTLVNDEGFIDDQGKIIMINFRNKKFKVIKEEILSISENELITKNYDSSFMKMTGGNHLIFVYKSCD